ncbi:hypothetical protein, conserved [Eimeria tenella]|uniref:Uncharacterized protein n=1 Tax=Eimeria tenella TaxID=5802 RepID=U6KZ72_EIMTE|nr:hypothetical protein, conserved [Eimeria tenella]CDJ41624.1 hypothetical protein, conserved [Eimeria tenella]|eukprot:XP_013232374.1 hypothetical protein, conserved [Eimeria tenella]
MQKCIRATGGEAAAAAADLGNSSLSSEPSRDKAATGTSRWKHLFCSGSKTGSSVEQQQQQQQPPQPQQQQAEALPPSSSDSKSGLTRRLLWHQRKHHSCPTAAPAAALAAADSAAAGGEAAAAGGASGAAPNGRSAPAAAAAAANSLNPRHSTCPPLIRGRSVRFGPAEVREFLPDTESGNPSRDNTQVGHSVEEESQGHSEMSDLEAGEEWRAILEPVHRSSSGLLVSDTLAVGDSSADNEAEHEGQSASEDDEVGGVLSILRRDIAAAAAAAAITAADGSAAAAAQEETTETPDAVEEDLEGGRYVCASRLFSF